MKGKVWILLAGVAILGMVALVTSNSLNGQGRAEASVSKGEELPPAAEGLPGSLDNFFPPKAEQPRFLFQMFKMGTAFSGILADLFENDAPNVKGNFEQFKTAYLEVSEWVPEWKSMYPMEPVEQLGSALETTDSAKVMAAVQKVGEVCHTCHITYMVPVQQRYHWGNPESIRVQDPVTGQEMNFSQLMQALNTSFAGISVNVLEGQKANAQKQFDAFKARFNEMRTSTCDSCHSTERKYYVDEEVQDIIDALGQALAQPSLNSEEIQRLTQQLGMESCFKCHLVHIPAAFAPSRMRGSR